MNTEKLDYSYLFIYLPTLRQKPFGFCLKLLPKENDNMDNTIGLYLHIPFCRKKCAYCNFFSRAGSEADYDAYQIQLQQKIKEWGQTASERVSGVYFGGGTPSILGTERLCALLGTVKASFAVNADAEVTVEVNPESGGALNFEKLKAAGFNRVSVGLQSAIPREIQELGRLHTPQEAALTVRLAQKAGIRNTSLDLMMGIPYQTKDSLRDSIRFCADSGVTHISSYILKVEEGTPLYARRGQLALPDEDEQADLYLSAVAYLEQLGYRQYEISNFAVPSFESRHNTLYWRCGEYIGIGPSAYSFYHGRRFHYESSLQAFGEGRLIDDGEGGSEEEYVMLALRLKEGLNFSDYARRFGKPFSANAPEKIKQFARFGFMELDGERACFTPKGFLVSNSILAELI